MVFGATGGRPQTKKPITFQERLGDDRLNETGHPHGRGNHRGNWERPFYKNLPSGNETGRSKNCPLIAPIGMAGPSLHAA